MGDAKKKNIWVIVLILLIGLTLYAIVGNNESFTFEGFVNYVKAASGKWIFLAFLCMMGF